MYCCPVCGSDVNDEIPYSENGQPSFEICPSCGFQYGYDDDPGATDEACEGIKNNWDRWLKNHIDDMKNDRDNLNDLIQSLMNIDVKLGFDLLIVRGDK